MTRTDPFSKPDTPGEEGHINYPRAVGNLTADMRIMEIDLSILIDFHSRGMSPHVLAELIKIRDKAAKNTDPFIHTY